MNIINQNFFPNVYLLFLQLYKIQIKLFLLLYQLIKMNKRISHFNYPPGNQRLRFSQMKTDFCSFLVIKTTLPKIKSHFDQLQVKHFRTYKFQ